jgi:hypothetical protein
MTADSQAGLYLNGVSSSATIDVGLYRCTVAGNGFDGPSYKGNCTFLESDCVAYGNGLNLKSGTSNYGKSNGFTTHNFVKGVRTNGTAYGNAGPNFADSAIDGQIAVLNLGCFAYDSWGDRAVPHYNTDFAVISTESTGGYDGSARVWLIDCKTFAPDGKSSTSTFGINVDRNNKSAPLVAYFTGDWFSRSRLSGGATMANVTRLRFPT